MRGEHTALQGALHFPEQDAPTHITEERGFDKTESHYYQTAL